jgi:hypothetical protein
MNHSKIVGGSTAKRVINCPGSVALVATMPQQEGSSYANEGSLLHEAIAIVMDTGCAPEDMVGFEAHGSSPFHSSGPARRAVFPANFVVKGRARHAARSKGRESWM